MKQWEELKDIQLDPRSLIKKQVGNGRDTSFWKDWWIGEKPLYIKYPRIFSLKANKEITVEAKLGSVEGVRE